MQVATRLSLVASALVLLTPAASGQFSSQRPIAALPDSIRCIHAADLDGDGDADVLGASDLSTQFPLDEVVWFENLGGGAFGPQRVLDPNADAPRCVFAADLDGDGDEDVLAAIAGDDAIVWYENLGAGAFGTRRVITTLAGGAWHVFATDVDGDGDSDVLSASIDDDTIAWYENLGGGSFGPQRVISALADGANTVHAADVDGDGDADVFSSSGFDNKVAWYENLGNGSFGSEQLLASFVGSPAVDVLAIDLDGDGDPDALAGAYSHTPLLARITWYENLGGGVFGPEQVLSTEALQLTSLAAGDLDGDGDADVLSTSRYGLDSVAWYENLGAGAFGPQQVITLDVNTPVDVDVADLDSDGRPDVIAVILYASEQLTWHRNQFGSTSRYCQPAVANRSGEPGVLSATGSVRVVDDDMTLRADSLPQNVFGYLLASRQQGFVAGPGGSFGNLCLAGAIGRFVGPGQVQSSGLHGRFDLALDLSRIPTPNGLVAVLPGETWYFQCWHRDFAPTGGAGSNFTDALSIAFQ